MLTVVSDCHWWLTCMASAWPYWALSCDSKHIFSVWTRTFEIFTMYFPFILWTVLIVKWPTIRALAMPSHVTRLSWSLLNSHLGYQPNFENVRIQGEILPVYMLPLHSKQSLEFWSLWSSWPNLVQNVYQSLFQSSLEIFNSSNFLFCCLLRLSKKKTQVALLYWWIISC